MNKITTEKQEVCGVCASKRLVEVLDLPQLPLTGIFIKRPQDGQKFKPIDQGWQLCQECGHAQLREVVAGEYLYGDSYSHRGGESPIAKRGLDYFAEWILDIFSSRTFSRVLDVGCNDGYLLKLLSPKAKRLAGIDPIWTDRDFRLTKKIMIRGGWATADNMCQEDLGGQPDLITATHVFEHLANPSEVLAGLLVGAADDAIVVIEVPSFDTMLKLCRFDQIFHQHINYFSLASLARMIAEAGGYYITHAYNYSLWGGTIMIALGKMKTSKRTNFAMPQLAHVKQRYQVFQGQLQGFQGMLAGINEPLYGFGAAQILPMLAYHMDSDLGFLKAIIDDDKSRQGHRYPGLNPIIKAPDDKIDYSQTTAVVTALDSARAIISRGKTMGFRYIVTPTHIC